MSEPGDGAADEGAAMHAEFDSVAGWTADVALDLGVEHHVPAGCRGSANPATLRWLLDRLEVRTDSRMLDCGAGVGGPAAFARAETGVVPVLTEPEPQACAAARRLFGLPVAVADARLPVATGSVDVGWSLGVLCTVADQLGLLRELRRVLAPGGRYGLLVFVAATAELTDPPEGNHFPTEAHLADLLAAAGLSVTGSASVADFAAFPSWWDERVAAVETELGRRHGDDPAWVTAQDQSARFGALLESGQVSGQLLVGTTST